MAGEEYPVGRRWGEGRRRFYRRGEGEEKGEKTKGDKEKKKREEKISQKIETEKGFFPSQFLETKFFSSLFFKDREARGGGGGISRRKAVGRRAA